MLQIPDLGSYKWQSLKICLLGKKKVFNKFKLTIIEVT